LSEETGDVDDEEFDPANRTRVRALFSLEEGERELAFV
jgi:hypothetical protein